MRLIASVFHLAYSHWVWLDFIQISFGGNIKTFIEEQVHFYSFNMLLTVFFTGLGIIYLAFVLFIIIGTLREDRKIDRDIEAAVSGVEINDLDDDDQDAIQITLNF